MRPPNAPTSLELQALSVLWIHGPSTVSTVLELFPDGRERAYTTILSVMQSLEKKKLVKPTRNGRSNIYSATKSQHTIMRPLALEFVNHAFGGSLGDAISTLLSSSKLTPEEKTALERELKEHKAMAKKKTAKKASKKKATPVRKVAKKATKKTTKKAAKKAVKKKVAKKVVRKKVAKKATKKVSKKAVKKTAKKKVAGKKKTAKKASKKKVARKR